MQKLLNEDNSDNFDKKEIRLELNVAWRNQE